MTKAVEIVGILNVTPDSFSDGGEYLNSEAALARLDQLFAEGADKVDIGGEATNPWAIAIDINEEWRRLEPILRVAVPKYGEQISLDTRHPEIVERALAYGRFIINDVTGLHNLAMIQLVAENGLTVIASHLPAIADGDIQYAHDYVRMEIAQQVKIEMVSMRSMLIKSGIPKSNIILDPGIGFGKSMVCNWQLLEIAKMLKMRGQPIMIGASRKRMLATNPETGQDIPGVDKTEVARSVAAAKIAITACQKTRNPLWLRVHDVPAHVALLNEIKMAA